MTQKQIEQTRVIAEKDGWKSRSEGSTLLYREDCSYENFDNELPYLTSLDWLHPVAMDVKTELRKKNTCIRQILVLSIRKACFMSPINGEYIDLFNAVYEGIVYLQNQEK